MEGIHQDRKAGEQIGGKFLRIKSWFQEQKCKVTWGYPGKGTNGHTGFEIYLTPIYWLVVSPILKNISPWEELSHILWKIKNVPNHLYDCTYIYMCVCMYIYICVCVCMYYIYKYMWIIYLYIHIYIYMYRSIIYMSTVPWAYISWYFFQFL